MNSCILMARVIQAPELRYTQENQTPLAQMLVEFPALRDGDPPVTLRVVGWGNLANEIKANYQVGEQVILEGRLNMNTVDRPEGFKEKRAELTASRIYKVGMPGVNMPPVQPPMETPVQTMPSTSPQGDNVVAFNTSGPQTPPTQTETPDPSNPIPMPNSPQESPERNLDDIPF